MKTYNFPEGELFEGYSLAESAGFEIVIDHPVSKKCRHCHSEEISMERSAVDPEYQREWRQYICPAVVVAYNEGGQCCTGVCLDCILEAAKTIER